MKHRALFILMLVLLSPLAGVMAQDETAVPAPGFAVQMSPAVNITPNDDDTATLELEDVFKMTAWLQTSAAVALNNFDTERLALSWSATDELSAAGVLRSADYALLLNLRDPVYDVESGSLTYTVTITDIIDPTDTIKDDRDLPSFLGAGTLFITVDDAFLNAIQAGRESLVQGVRAAGSEEAQLPFCDAAQGTYPPGTPCTRITLEWCWWENAYCYVASEGETT